MARVKPLLDELELQHVQRIEIDDDQVLVEHEIPALEGDFFQREGRRATRVKLNGVMTGDDVGDKLKTLREKFLKTEPVPFVSDITAATRVEQVMVAEIAVKEIAGKTQRFEYALALNEYIEPPPTSTETPETPGEDPPRNIIDPVEQRQGTLVVEVTVEGEPAFDFSTITVTVRGNQENGEALSTTLADRMGNVWTEEEMPASESEYLVEATEAGPNPLTGAANAVVQAGQVTTVSITLHPTSNIAKTFLVHFRFDSAFVEPCMREVLKEVAAYAGDHPGEKMLIVGHTDRAGSNAYNQSLSERRARSVYGYLRFGNDRTVAFDDWNTLRQARTGPSDTSMQDNWAAREYQQILQDLNFYPGKIDGDHGPATDDAVQAYRCHKGLLPGTQVDDDVWAALIDDYLGQDNLAVPASQFFPNCSDTEILKWLGCGEEDPKDRRESAFRPSRRTEILFVRVDALPCEVPIPVTFNTTPPGDVGPAWCLDQGNAGGRCCFLSPVLTPGTNDPEPCPSDPAGPWCRQPADPGQITVQGTIFRELADGTLEPAANQQFVLIAPDGAFKDSESSNGEPRPARTGTGANAGTFSFPDMPKGFYSLEVVSSGGAVLARLEDASGNTVRGAQVCKALRSDADRLNVVILNAAAMREITLPVVAHVMTALHPVTREVRLCTDGLGNVAEQRSALTDQEIREAFEEANRIWQQGRVRFELVDIVRESYAFRTECEVDESEFVTLLERCAYSDVVNVFFVGDLDGNGEAGFGVSPEGGASIGVSGCAVGDRFQTTVLGPPINVTLDADQRAQVVAHELGHFLNLPHADETPANADRLMLPGSSTASNTTIVQDEVDIARASQGAVDDCVPLTLTVDGASQVGGTLSDQFIFVQHPDLQDPFDVTVDAIIPDHVLANGTLVMTGGDAGATPLQRTVSKGTPGVFEVEAVFTPNGGGNPTTARVIVTIATLELRVDGATRLGAPDSTLFVARRELGFDITVIAQLQPAPFCIPESLIEWNGGDAQPDPMRRTVSQGGIEETEVEVTVAGESRAVTIRVFDSQIISNILRVPTPSVMLHGIVNDSRGSFGQDSIVDGQEVSMIQIRVLLPGIAEDTIETELTSLDPGNNIIERIDVELARSTPGDDIFLSHPILAIRHLITRSDVTLATPQDIEFVRGQAGGRLILNVDEALVGNNSVEIPVRGRVLYVAVQAYQQGGANAGVSEADIRADIVLANEIWAQGGIEIKERSVQVGVQDPGGLLELERGDSGRTEEEQRLLGTHPDCAANPAGCAVKSPTASDLNVYYLREIDDALGVSYTGENVIAIEGPGRHDSTLAHEIGHQLMSGWGCAGTADTSGEHLDPDCDDWPDTNIMTPSSGTPPRRDIDASQVENVLDHANTTAILVIE